MVSPATKKEEFSEFYNATRNYREMFSWCSVYDPLLVSKYFDRKSEFLSKYDPEKLKSNEEFLIRTINNLHGGCDTLSFMIKMFDSEKFKSEFEKLP